MQWNEVLLNEFVRLAMLNEVEEGILRSRCKGESIVQMAYKYSVSTRTVDRIIHSLKEKYDVVQPYSKILPKRL